MDIEEESRKPLSWMLIILNMTAVFLSCLQNGYIIYAPENQTDQIGIVFVLILAFDIFICLYTSFYLANKWEIIQLYFLIDNIILVGIAASIGFVSFN
jgi:hypothetical protein